MLWVLLAAVIAALVFGPSLWVRHVMSRHAGERPDLPGTGAELARHLLDRFGLENCRVEVTDHGDHYDPDARAVRLSSENHDGRSVTAAAVAAHEVGHALQHRDDDPAFLRRQRVVRASRLFDKVGSISLLGLSLAVAVLSPNMLLLGIGAVAVMGLVRVVAQLVTLPVELDASFNRALPILDRDRYLHAADLDAARAVLKAAAWTYVASALMQMLNLIRIFRR